MYAGMTGECDEVDYCTITDADTCATAAAFVGNSDTTPALKDQMSLPRGCTVAYSGSLRFNSAMESELVMNGPNSNTDPRKMICKLCLTSVEALAVAVEDNRDKVDGVEEKTEANEKQLSALDQAIEQENSELWEVVEELREEIKALEDANANANRRGLRGRK